MRQYLDLLSKVLAEGIETEDRTGVGVKSLFGTQMRFNLQEGFPLLTTKKIHWKSVVHELLWMLKGDTNIKYLQDNGVHIWDAWADKEGNLGPVYGAQWRKWKGGPNGNTDQIYSVLCELELNPTSRRMVVNSWNVGELPNMALAPCHFAFQFHTRMFTKEQRWRKLEGNHRISWFKSYALTTMEEFDELGIPRGFLDCQLYQRSADIFLGVPFNVASYSLLTLMVAQCVNMVPGEFIWTGGDTHLYLNHLEQATLQLTREPLPLPQVVLNPQVKDLFQFTYEDITLEGYTSHPPIKAPVAV